MKAGTGHCFRSFDVHLTNKLEIMRQAMAAVERNKSVKLKAPTVLSNEYAVRGHVHDDSSIRIK